MSELRERLKKEFRDRDYREAYAEDFLNTNIATQIRVIREQRGLTQAQLAEKIGTKQAGISRVENVNYSAWNIGTLKKIAFAFGVRLKVSFETFGSLIDEAVAFSREALERPAFEDDPVFPETTVELPESEVKLPLAAKRANAPHPLSPLVGATGGATQTRNYPWDPARRFLGGIGEMVQQGRGQQFHSQQKQLPG